VAVTPLSLDQYFVYRAGLYGLVSVPLVLVVHELLGVVAVPTALVAVVALVAMPLVPLMALIISGFASNQVEGFAVMKGAGVLLVGPLASFFIPRPWDLLVGVLPTYWPIEAYFAAVEGGMGLFWAAAALAPLYPSAWIVCLHHRFRRRATAG
jgi:fluoroquinolone transport system permease protein